MRKKKNFKCKVCGVKKHSAHGFCKYHAWAFSKGKIDCNGKPMPLLFYDENWRLKKEKDTFARTIKESNWYRKWQNDVIEKANKKCRVCGRTGIALVVHHKLRFSKIIQDAKRKYNTFKDRFNYCKNKHVINIGECLCRECHAEKHIGEKVYSSMKGKIASGKCKVCGADEYCKKFCSRHYKAFQVKSIDINGKRLKLQKMFDSKRPCIVCGKESVGRGGVKIKFCKLHFSRFWRGIIDKNGKQIRKLKLTRSNGKCKICESKHFSKGLCLMHYNRFKIGQIDINGKELRKLGIYDVRGSKSPTKYIIFNGKRLSFQECAQLVGISVNSMKKRLKNWGIERALTTPK